MNNIGLAYIKMKRYEDALSIFEPCTEAKLDFNIGLNFIVCAHALNHKGKMKIGFQYLLEIPPEVDDCGKYATQSDDSMEKLVVEAIKHDPLCMWEKENRERAQKTILTATNIISPCIASSFADGYTWYNVDTLP
ncbi:unnamed protein product [Soboliphyme baturini]|uniref:TPR_REGION domain-containing protein n=1 Tax=Soboliphyme baturini TaxID=241478 RepID=A0A183IZS4_9BILA|nr:unnamed protein product [Soboliphyme baturini]